MVNIHLQFNSLFKNWFDILIEDETINVRVDEDFTPIIDQNGYETSIDNLSGGERTSVALAYRLALNKVVNDVVSTIMTKDIIMLDEPTDGFSTEQLDKVRDILLELKTKQIIIVSHESKIESFVQNIIRIEKREHISVVN
jgi:exonuclease SbcC